MKDSEILGTGNSRYLKSAIGAAATWEEARAMLIAGTFPIDFNGINEAGFARVGDALNKNNLLKDRTEVALFGSAADRTVDDAFYGIGNKLKLIMSDMASITLTVKSASGNALSGVLVHGIYDDSGNEMLTDSSGVVMGYVAEGSATISISGYADIVDYSETINVVKGNSYTKTITVSVRDFLKITSSKNLKFSGNVEQLDVTAVGGGGGGGGGVATHVSIQAGGGGGGGGYCVVEEAVAFTANTSYAAIIGAGGVGGTSYVGNYTPTAGGNGGATSFAGVTAAGGSGGGAGSSGLSSGSGGLGGGGNGIGGRGSARNNNTGTVGGDGSVLGYSSASETVRYGGGGGGGSGGANSNYPGTAGGADFGAGGAGYVSDPTAASNTGGGGGGGRVYYSEEGSSSKANGGAGGSGCVAIRMHLKAA